MHSKSFLKIVNAGFTFYRERWNGEQNGGQIWKASLPGKWTLHEKGFKSKAALLRAMQGLLDNDPFAITEH